VTSFLSPEDVRAQRLILGGTAGSALAGGVAPGRALLVHGGPGARWGALEALAPMSREGRAIALVGMEDLPAAALEAAGWNLAVVVSVCPPPTRRLEAAASLAEVVDVLVLGELVVDPRWPRLLARVRRRRALAVVVERTCGEARHRILAAAGSLDVLDVHRFEIDSTAGLPSALRVHLVRGTLQRAGSDLLGVAG
jgi:hypothetical protein